MNLLLGRVGESAVLVIADEYIQECIIGFSGSCVDAMKIIPRFGEVLLFHEHQDIPGDIHPTVFFWL